MHRIFIPLKLNALNSLVLLRLDLLQLCNRSHFSEISSAFGAFTSNLYKKKYAQKRHNENKSTTNFTQRKRRTFKYKLTVKTSKINYTLFCNPPQLRNLTCCCEPMQYVLLGKHTKCFWWVSALNK